MDDDHDDDRPLCREAMAILAAATLIQLLDDAKELAALFAGLDVPERERLSALLFGAEA